MALNPLSKLFRLFLPICLALSLSACDWLSLASLWMEPRDLLVSRVEAAKDAQEDTVEEFQTAMGKFKAVTSFDGGDLEKQFNTLNDSFESSEAAANDIRKRVDQVVGATNGLLDEWKNELEQYHDASLRSRAERQFDATRVQANQMIEAMRRAESKTKPVLDVLRDQVLFMKHNLNMQAVTSLEQQTASIETDVASLIAEMRQSIAEANRFIEAMNSEG